MIVLHTNRVCMVVHVLYIPIECMHASCRQSIDCVVLRVAFQGALCWCVTLAEEEVESNG